MYLVLECSSAQDGASEGDDTGDRGDVVRLLTCQVQDRPSQDILHITTYHTET